MSSEAASPNALWQAARALLIGCGMAEPLLRIGRLGLEIGALHCPLPLPPGVCSLYVDKSLPVELRTLRPDVQNASIVATNFLANGFRLQYVADVSQDFVIANHVLPHAVAPY